MDEIQKILQRLSPKEREAMELLMQQVKRDYRSVPGVKALQGMHGWFRVRMGRYRIIFLVNPETGKVEIRRITKKNERTYKGLR